MKIYWIDYDHKLYKIGYDKKQKIKSFCEENNLIYINDSKAGTPGIGIINDNESSFFEEEIYNLAKEFNIHKLKTSKRSNLVFAKNEAIRQIRIKLNDTTFSVIYDFEKAIESIDYESILTSVQNKFNITLDNEDLFDSIKKSFNSY